MPASPQREVFPMVRNMHAVKVVVQDPHAQVSPIRQAADDVKVPRHGNCQRRTGSYTIGHKDGEGTNILEEAGDAAATSAGTVGQSPIGFREELGRFACVADWCSVDSEKIVEVDELSDILQLLFHLGRDGGQVTAVGGRRV